MKYSDTLLSELEELGAIGDKHKVVITPDSKCKGCGKPRREGLACEDCALTKAEPERDQVEEFFEGNPKGHRLEADERTYKIMALVDLTVKEFDRMIEGLSTVREALKELGSEFRSSAAPSEGWLTRAEGDVDIHSGLPGLGEEEEVFVQEYNAQGTPNAMGDITLTIPPSVPLPEED